MPIELDGIRDKQTQGMRTVVLFGLNMEPSQGWIDTFHYAPGVQVTNYPRSMFQFEKDTMTCSFMGPKLSEAHQTAKLYVADANKKFEEGLAMRKSRKEVRAREDEKRRQTEMLTRELFDDETESS